MIIKFLLDPGLEGSLEFTFTITLVRFKISSPSDLVCILASKKQTFGTKIKIVL